MAALTATFKLSTAEAMGMRAICDEIARVCALTPFISLPTTTATRAGGTIDRSATED